MGRRGAAAAPHQVEETRLGPLANMHRHLVGFQIVAAEGVGQTGVGVHRDIGFADAGKLFDILAQLLGAQRTVQTKGERLGMAQRVVEGFGGLAGEGTA